MRSSAPLFDSLAPSYDRHFQVPHRRAYDDLAWEFVQPLTPRQPGCVVDAGCGVGRWSERLLALGHAVIGVEQAPAMAKAARARLADYPSFTLIERPMEEVDLPQGRADLVIALGSLQYSRDPSTMIQRFARWTKPGGAVFVLVDSLVALVLELVALGRPEDALTALRTRMGTWIQADHIADNHQLDRSRLVTWFSQSGLTEVSAHGLLVGASALGRHRLSESLESDWERQMALERRLASDPLLADLGKQLLVFGRKPQ
ncbi:ubiquinone/menaquinone biosynthesis C-methylase UbiE [Roseiarcus fermentans]|uniref:Ubiquinone/menaquinone biosynthesis C-methylase UbiE n=1 Tax=Roseiarcus fermentans TaxID=1473586 RepID=A0A366FJH7_9HYPH|nr:class I SAM-dependent methyltransferase [Roseiarcus fermentans]RBP14140.1 ubiquinone/menaquinone biosynthesis C-methylase UbiE [Roseiarcus fermentans]